ncbi:MAG: Dyp-type peroxidase family [Solirubrobacteraceae bacterium]|nr:Dyp-type peroxidase family [Solirubrobacteraceae bacterium]
MFVDPAPEAIGSYPPKEPILTPGQPSPYGGPMPPTFPPDLQAPPTREPKWIKNGTYMTVRASTFDAGAWDRRSLGEQEHVVGRPKVSGQPLDAPDDPNAPITDPN